MFSFLILLIQSYSESKSEFYEEYLEKDVYTVDVFYRITCKTKKKKKTKIFILFFSFKESFEICLKLTAI